MILTLLIIQWLIFGTMAVSIVFYKNFNDNQVLGVTLSRKHAGSPEVRKILKSYQRDCCLVLLLSVGASLLMLVEGIRSYAEFFMLVLIMANLFANWFVIRHYEQELLSVKKKNGWVYRRTSIVTVDMDVAKEKGKSGISVLWTWLFFCLSFLPTVFLLIQPETQAYYPIALSLIGPLCQLSMVYLYYQMRNQHAPAPGDDSELNKACAGAEERVNTAAATLSALAMLSFWIFFNLSITYGKGVVVTVLPAVFLIAALLLIASWQQRKIRATENRFFGGLPEDDGNVYERETTWKWGFYYNPGDPRIIVPKRVASMGWTVNIGRPAGKAVGAAIAIGTIALVLVAGGVISFGSTKDYLVTGSGNELLIDAAMYDLTLEKDQIIGLSTIGQLPGGTRTNGYGGVNKSFGHFSLDGYGKCMLYVYNNADEYIVLQLNGDNPGYVILNDKTREETNQLYQTISRWMEE